MKLFRLFFAVLFMAVSCGSTVDPDNQGQGGRPGGQTGNGEGGSSSPDTPAREEGALIADGNDEGTYDLILSSGYNYETPDYSGAHASDPFRHIRQSYDDRLGKYVFDFYLHIENDDDRGKPDIRDRQRNEIKTDAKSPESMVARKGETLRMTWKFRLPDGMKTTTKFAHIHQLKGIDNSEGTADVDMPLITYTVRSTNSGGQQFQVIYVGPSPSSNTYLAKEDLGDFLGEWVEAEETVRFDDNGSYDLRITRLTDGKELVSVSRSGISFWREGTVGMRPKWGLYRSFGDNGSLKPELRDEILKFADFKIEKL